MSDEQGTSLETLSELQDTDDLEIVEEIQCEKEMQEVSPVLFDTEKYQNVSCLQVVDETGKNNVLDLLNMTLVKCYTAEGETYRLVSNDAECDDSETIACILSAEGGGQEEIMVVDENIFLQTEYESETPKQEAVNQQPSPQWILEKARAYQQSKTLLATLQRRQRKGRRRKGELPPPHELLTSPTFKLYLYSCKMCNFKCNAIKELQAHRATEHAGVNSYRVKNTTSSMQCPKCPYRAHTHGQLSRHLSQSHARRAADAEGGAEAGAEAEGEPINLDTDEVNAADVLVCGACGFESPSKDDFRAHIREEHGAVAC